MSNLIFPANDETLSAEKEAERYARIKERLRLAADTFTPSRPVQAREIFKGRTDQLFDCLSISDRLGLHGILFGDRGVGKTSIANMVRLLSDSSDDDIIVKKVECTSKDDFADIMKSVYRSVPVSVMEKACGFGSVDSIATKSLSDLIGEKTSFKPKDVAYLLKQMQCRMLIILDEFDRLDKQKFDLSSLTELIKITSDTEVDVHFLIVGVGESVDDIVGNHASIVRNITQIKLGSMNDKEIGEIIAAGMRRLSLSIPNDVAADIVSFSCGYPHYTHLLCLDAACNTIRAERLEVERADLEYAISRALSKAQESIKNSYHDATRANRQNIYKEVLQACGAVALDEYNTFAPKDLEKHLTNKLKRPMKATQFGAHLINLCKPERGGILVSIGQKGRARYRFRDPLMRAYVRLAVGNRR
ncbi:AAA family ATPase [Sphingomonas parapaucimobilis]|uniref:AAA family ATPase n=1 Tax=Sphingomonas parapaucimobilis TaxID=28213 RepID=UPI0039EBFACB